MKSGKRPTVNQRKLIKNAGLDHNDWLIVKNLPHELTIVHRVTGQQRSIILGGN